MNNLPSEIFFHNLNIGSGSKNCGGIFTFCEIIDFVQLKFVNKFLNFEVYNSLNNGIIDDFYYHTILRKYFRKNLKMI